MSTAMQDLVIRSESVQRLYDQYVSDRFQVNRRYQRKLVWTVEEKQKLIDSMLRDLPLPLVLVAELTGGTNGVLELIDGLQRMNAIFSFLENEYSVDGEYFDLDALADTKLRKDSGFLVQKTPVMSRQASNDIANYTIALSVFRAPDQASIEEVFRRINSGGRRLSRQSLRQAGTVSPLADLVRVISSRIRGDTSPGDSVPLRQMPKLSVTNYNLDYGVKVDDIFWVKNGVLRREDIRESLDEQLVLDLLLDCLIDPLPTSGTRIRDDYYNYVEGDREEPTRASISIASAIEIAGMDRIVEAFMRAYDEVRNALENSEKKFSQLVGVGSGGRAPRYFHGVFLAVHELLFRDRMQVRDYGMLADALDGISSGALSVPGGGGDWTGQNKRSIIDGVKGVIRGAFEGPVEGDDLGSFGYSSQLETLLGNAIVEQQLFDCKQGLLSLGRSRSFDDGCLLKISRTLSAMANSGPGAVGYVAIGIADSARDALRVKEIDGVDPVLYRGFSVVGIEREAVARNEALNDYWHWLVQKICGSPLDQSLARGISANARLVPYRNLAVGLLKVEAGAQPSFFNGELFERSGSDTLLVAQEDYMRIFSRFS
ncbi:DUF262 domain-containing protein [Nocardiopsis dassonvillei]|uniref:GmrSD restriction endonuclease domain-containing protein n=1 Tax=Nocardiopsis dassonvillei TaxID=2014 RepID=UPI0036FD23D3